MSLASWTGEAGDVDGAVRLLEALLRDATGADEGDGDLARKSLDFWRSIRDQDERTAP
jgi:hypothetical protein